MKGRLVDRAIRNPERAWIAGGLGLASLLSGAAAVADLYHYHLLGGVWVGAVLFLLTVPIVQHAGRALGDTGLVRTMLIAAGLKIFGGALARYLMVYGLYGGVGDANRYHAAAVDLAERFRQGEFGVPGKISGTRFIEVLTGGVYSITFPTRLGSFMFFSWLAFIGMLYFLRALHTAHPDGSLRRYAYLVLFFPTLVFWPSSVGKEAWMILCLGIATYGVAAVYSGRVAGSLWAVLGLWGCAAVRPHMAVILVVAMGAGFAVKALGGRPGAGHPTMVKRRGAGLVSLLVLVCASVFVVGRAQEFFNLGDLSVETTKELLEATEAQTAMGRSEFEGGGGGNPVVAAATVLFRPFLFEAHNLQAGVAAVEGMLLLLVLYFSAGRLARLPLDMSKFPYVAMAVAYVAGFILAFSRFQNFGLLARQRTQLLPFLFVLVVTIPPALRSSRKVGPEVPDKIEVPV